MKRLNTNTGWEIVEEEWPDFKGEIFKERPRHVAEILENTVRAYPEKIGFISGDQRLTFKAFDQTVNRIAAGLTFQGVKKGDHVALLLGVKLEFPLSFFALMKLGTVVVPLNTRFKGEELAYELDDSESKFLIVDAQYWPLIASVHKELKTVQKIFCIQDPAPEETVPFSLLMESDPNEFTPADLSEADNALIMYTSGTTGKPKGAVLHHRGLVLTAMLVSDFIQFETQDRMICCIPLFHITGLGCLMLPTVFSGVACVYMHEFNTKNLLEIMAKERVTQYMGVINIIWLMINHPEFENYDFSAFRTSLFGGSPATEEMVKGIFDKLPHMQISVGYGLTECFAITTSTPYPDALRKIKAVGKCLPLVHAKVVDDDGRDVPTGETGEILLKGAKTFRGYWKNPDATRETIVNDWVHTGDIGKIDDEGFIYILDRKKDMINRGGEKIYSLEVENVIYDNPKVLEAAVVGASDPVLGEVVKACIVLKPGERAEKEEIQKLCAERLADYKVPKYVEFMTSLPRNPAGKVNKPELRRGI